ncbi:phage baseplate assembly protein [Rhodopila sp.]|uniref:phage baseplate assembly protein n=1 Tax=Rhodopila sp. TaxID=2480087 RepID=UPI003D0ED35A
MSGAQQGNPTGTLTLLVNGQALTGWEATRVTRSIDRVPSDFDIELSERYPTDPSQMSAMPGATCQVMIDSDKVLTGYVDRVVMQVSPSRHNVRIMGRSKLEDIHDCSITPSVLLGGSILTASLTDLATRICAPYGISVKNLSKTNVSLPTYTGDIISAILTETGWTILERVSRCLGVLLYDDADGNLVIADVGTSTMASGFEEGVNIQDAGVSFSADERFHTYLPNLTSMNVVGGPASIDFSSQAVIDADIRPARQMIVVSEQFQLTGNDSVTPFAVKRAQWEAARRKGRSQTMSVACDSWRDSAGTLWQPNAYAPITLPSLKQVQTSDPWVIASVGYLRDPTRGTIAEVMMMPKGAFQPAPELFTNLLPSANTPGGDPLVDKQLT